jgi:hypothetical protein
MTTFPALTPSSRIFTPGRYPHSEIDTLSGLQARVRTSNVLLDQQLRLTFLGLTEAEMLSVRSHYVGQRGRFLSFTIPNSLLSGMTTPAYFTPTGYSWIYANAPQVEDIPCAQRYNVSVELVTVPPEGANINGFNLTVTASLTAGAVSGDLGASAPGAALAVAVSLTAGAVSGDLGASAPGFDMTVTASLAAGAAESFINAPGAALTVAVSFAAGAASVDPNGSASGFALTVTASLAAGAASSGVLTASHSWATAASAVALAERIGYRFTVGAANINCQSLGVYLASISSLERVIIHRVDTGAVIASADITSTANAWVDVSITPVVLSAGVQYVISTRRVGGGNRGVYTNHTGLNFNAAIGSISYRFGSSDNQPTQETLTTYAPARFLFA